MAQEVIYPVLLCGGSGTRLWPLSRKSYPKQFAPLTGKQSLFQASAQRFSGDYYADPVVLTNADYRFIVTEQLSDVGMSAEAILIEPEGRNTAPAILAAAQHLRAKGEDALILVAPSDHVIPDTDAFREVVEQGAAAARDGKIVTFGITPTRPETGYGYLELGEKLPSGAIALQRFVEKPNAARAAEMVMDGGFLWNAGIFLFSVKAILAAFEAHAAEMMEPVARSLKDAERDLDFLRLDPEAWATCPSDSIDYAVMERSDNLAVVPFSAGWSDLGDWDAVWREGDSDGDGNVISGSVEGLDCTDSVLRSEDPDLMLVGLGLKDVIAVAMPDAVLVADRSKAQEVKQVVAALKARDAKQAETLPRDYRPWGWFESLVLAEKFQVKRIVVNPGGTLSLQSHKFRSEHWIVVEGVATVTIDEEVKDVPENASVYIPQGAVHRMENRADVPMVLIEVQTGTYFGEDDITRYEDVYARN